MQVDRENVLNNPIREFLQYAGHLRELKNFSKELEKITGLLQGLPQGDSLSVELVKCHTVFCNAVTARIELMERPGAAAASSVAPNELLQKYVLLLQGLLKDPLSNQQLKAPLLGGDGRTYSQHTLELFWDRVPREFRGRSPMEYANSTPLDPKPHRVAQLFLDWVQEHQPYAEQFYTPLPPLQPPAVPKPSQPPASESCNDENRLRAMRQAIRERKLQRTKAAAAEVQPYLDKAEEAPAIVAARVAINATDQKMQADIATLNEQRREFVQHNDKEDAAIKNAYAEKLAAMKQQLIKLQEQAKELNKRDEELEQRQEKMNAAIDEGERLDRQLQQEIIQAERAANARESQWLGTLITAVAVVGVCAIACWMMPPGIVITPQSFSGAMGASVSFII